jgi:hypothetical protein
VRDSEAESCGLTAISLRPATPADDEFCFQLHRAAMSPYMAPDSRTRDQPQTSSLKPLLGTLESGPRSGALRA